MSVEITTLPSGLRVVTDKMDHLETASLGVWIGAGSRHEQASEQGLSHLLEHMAFKGTRRRSAREIAEEIETAGGDLNAATSIENTAYYAHVLAEDSGLALDILADILTDSTFDAAELEREKGVILQEISAAEDTPDDLIFDLFNATAYPDQPIGRAILGTPEGVSSFRRETIGSYLNRHYRSQATVIGAAGAVDHKRIVEDAEKRFSALSSEPVTAPSKAKYLGGDQRLKKRLEQAHIVVGFEGIGYEHADHYAMNVFANVVGGGMSSRLFQEVREKRGLAYSIYAFHWGFSDSGLFGFYAGTSKKDVVDLMPVALDCMAQATQDISAVELHRAKAQMKVSLLAALESPGARAEQMARQLLAFNRVIPREEIIAKIESITIDDVRRVGAKTLTTAPTVTAIGPISKVMSPDRVAERLGGLRN